MEKSCFLLEKKNLIMRETRREAAGAHGRAATSAQPSAQRPKSSQRRGPFEAPHLAARRRRRELPAEQGLERLRDVARALLHHRQVPRPASVQSHYYKPARTVPAGRLLRARCRG